MRDPERVEAWVAEAAAALGPPRMLINNAAGNFLAHAIDLSPNGWRAVIDIVLNGTFYCSASVARSMREAGVGGSILNVIASYAWTGNPMTAHSAAAKAGVWNLARSLAVEWAPLGIRVNCIAPGPLDSEGAAERLFPTPEIREKMLADIPGRRFTTLDDVVASALFLLSDDAGAHHRRDADGRRRPVARRRACSATARSRSGRERRAGRGRQARARARRRAAARRLPHRDGRRRCRVLGGLGRGVRPRGLSAGAVLRAQPAAREAGRAPGGRARRASRSSTAGSSRDGERVVAVYRGEQLDGHTYSTSHAAVHPDYRRRGIYRALIERVLAMTRELGFASVVSSHAPSNNPAIIAKLSLGFRIDRLEIDALHGPCLWLRYYHDPDELAAYEFRNGPGDAHARAARAPLRRVGRARAAARRALLRRRPVDPRRHPRLAQPDPAAAER